MKPSVRHLELVPTAPREPEVEIPAGDADLMRRLAGGELAALGALFDRHHDDLRRFIARATAGNGDIDDLVQEAFLTLARAAPGFDGRATARPFLFGIAAQLVRRRRRSVGRLARALVRFAWAPDAPPPRTPEQEASGAEERTRFDAALARLTEEKRLVFLLFEREGLSGEDIAKSLEIPVNTVWTRLHHARAELRRALDPTGAGGSAGHRASRPPSLGGPP